MKNLLDQNNNWDENYMNIKFDSDDDLPLNKMIETNETRQGCFS